MPAPHRPLSARRGSVSAPDPLGRHWEINDNPSRTSFSTLTIVSVHQDDNKDKFTTGPSTISLREPPSHRRFGRRQEQSNTRLSFARSSFTGKDSGSPGSSPSSSPHLRPSSPNHHRSASGGKFQGKPRYTPEQLYELAKQSTNPRCPPTSSTSSSYSSKNFASPSDNTNAASPVTFRPLPPQVYLPFIDRPLEVTTLVSNPPTERLFHLLKQTFPKSPKLVVANTDSADNVPSPASSVSSASARSDSPLDGLPADTTTWSYSQLYTFMTTAPRPMVSDFVYVKKIRACILARSELIWERIRGALGVPDEWNDEEFLSGDDAPYDTEDSDALNTSDLEDNGMKAKGHWDDWDAILGSPIYSPRRARPLSTGSSNIEHFTLSSSISSLKDEQRLKDEVQDKLTSFHRKSNDTLPVPVDVGGDETISPTPQQAVTPPVDYGSDGHESPGSAFGLFIEPIIASPRLTSPYSAMSPMAPLSLPSSLGEATPPPGLGNIVEGAEEEEEESGAPIHDEKPDEPDNHIQVQGLRISTSLSFSSSNSSANSTPNVVSKEPVGVRRGSFGYGRARSDSDTESEYAYNPVADRAVGNPLFPSNFARLATAPTLAANNPSLRSPVLPPPPRYTQISGSSGVSIHHGVSRANIPRSSSVSSFNSVKSESHAPRRAPGAGLTAGFTALRGNRDMLSETGSNDYAITAGSGSSYGPV